MTLRENFAETAFFYPDLRHRYNRNRAIGIYRTRRVDAVEVQRAGTYPPHGFHGLLQAGTRTEKPFMIQPNLPRFLRKRDETSLAVD